MVHDYRERAPLGRTRNKKQRPGLSRGAAVLVAVGFFCAGFGAGWLAFRRPSSNIRGTAAATNSLEAAAVSETGPSAVKDPNFTFYYKLQKGEAPPLGTGINTPRKQVTEAVPPTPAQHETPAPAAKPPAVSRTANVKGRYCVQVASYQTKGDAEAVKSRLASSGLKAYILESNVGEKGIWYRVRIGKELDHSAASDLATKAGKDAIVVEEK